MFSFCYRLKPIIMITTDGLFEFNFFIYNLNSIGKILVFPVFNTLIYCFNLCTIKKCTPIRCVVSEQA